MKRDIMYRQRGLNIKTETENFERDKDTDTNTGTETATHPHKKSIFPVTGERQRSLNKKFNQTDVSIDRCKYQDRYKDKVFYPRLETLYFPITGQRRRSRTK